MKGDFTRFTFDRRKHYTAVLKQQGRVDLDADWNEQQEIDRHLRETTATDQIGPAGGPLAEAGFLIDASGPNLTIGKGRYYVRGILCENEQNVPVAAQPDLPPNAKLVRLDDGTEVALPPPAGLYLAYLDVWTRHVTALEDQDIREKGLGGPDTATRSKTVWQVRLARVGNVADTINCLSDLPAWNAVTAPPTGTLAARARPDEGAEGPCIVAAGAGYRRLENQHYRVEIHKGGKAGTATFKWSRDNGSVATTWTGKSGNDLTVTSSGRDSVLSFAGGQWIELIDDGREQTGQPGTLVRLAKVEGQVLTIDPATATGSVSFADFPSKPRIRRWDSVGETTVSVPAANDGYIALEDGVEIRFSGTGTYHTGNWWSIPARTTGQVEWPQDASALPAALLPAGIRHSFARLALLAWDGTAWVRKSDCRSLFPPLTGLVALSHVGGDGQEAMPVAGAPGTFVPLAQPLSVGVSNGRTPVAGASVQFRVKLGSGRLQGAAGTYIAKTNDAGIASCSWELDGATASQQVTATLLDATMTPVHLPVLFNAALSRADRVSYDPADSPELAGALTVQAAIDRLSKVGGGGCSTYTVSPEGDWQSVLNGIAEGEDAHICFQRGRFETVEPIVLKGKGKLKVTGCGSATQIVATGSESALHFEKCIAVEVSDLHLESHRTGSRNETLRLNGTLTAIDCESVRIEDLSARCAGGTAPHACCITVRYDNAVGQTPPRYVESVRIRGCDLTVGHLQTGILVVNTDRALIEDNRIAVRPKGSDLGFSKLMESKGRRRVLVRQLVAQPLLQEAAPTGQSSTNTSVKVGRYTVRLNSTVPASEWEKLFEANPPTAEQGKDLTSMARYAEAIVNRVAAGELSFGAFDNLVRNFKGSLGEGPFSTITSGTSGPTVLRNLMLTGKTVVLDAAGLSAEHRAVFVNHGNARVWFDSPMTQKDWNRLLATHPMPKGATTSAGLLRHVQRLANRLIHDETLRSEYPAAEAWYKGLIDLNPAVARSGVVCGGQVARNIRVVGNKIDGVLEGVHVGVSRRAAIDAAPDLAGQVTVASNDISMRLPMELKLGYRCIFIGNAAHVVVENNRMTVPAARGDDRLFREGIRIWGILGRMMIVRANMLESCLTGIRIEALRNPFKVNQWLVEDNMIPLASQKVLASAGVVERNNLA